MKNLESLTITPQTLDAFAVDELNRLTNLEQLSLVIRGDSLDLLKGSSSAKRIRYLSLRIDGTTDSDFEFLAGFDSLWSLTLTGDEQIKWVRTH